MKIRLLSDIHQEFYEDESLYKNKGEDVLVLAGDIHVGHKNVIETLKKFYEETKCIIYVSGNHEYYRSSIKYFDDNISLFTRDTNIHFLSPGSVPIGTNNGVDYVVGGKDDQIIFIGGNLWTNFRKDHIAKLTVPRNISDFLTIENFNADVCSNLHEQHIAYIKSAYEAYDAKKVIVSHFLPAVECIAPEYRGENLLNYYFANDYSNYISGLSNVPYWLFGHTHSNVDIHIGDVNLIANPYGYNKNKHYQEKLICL